MILIGFSVASIVESVWIRILLFVLGTLLTVRVFNSSRLSCSYHDLFWVVMAVVLTTIIIIKHPIVNNHDYLLTIAVIMIAVSLYHNSAPQYLEWCSRLILVVVMLAAVQAKVFSADYLSGEMFYHLLSNDVRFASVDDMFAKVLTIFPNIWFPISTSSTILSKVLTWWTIIIELLVGLSFVVFTPSKSLAPHIMLGIFILLTYTLIPISPFGVVLAALGLASAGTGFTHRLQISIGYWTLVVIILIARYLL